MKPGSPELAGGYAGEVVSNDTSAAVGYAPMTESERLVLEAERFANSPGFKASFPETGEDVKVMGVRTGRLLNLTLAVPILDRFLGDERDYFERKERVREAILSHVRPRLRSLARGQRRGSAGCGARRDLRVRARGIGGERGFG